jgi:enoyl-CoA hydratase/carnithine racemase
MGAAASASSVVTTALHGDVLVVTIDNPPVNALGAAVRQGLLAAMQQAQADAAVAAVLLVGAGKAFIAGADIREFGKPPVPPALPEVCRAIEGSDKPVVAVLHGAALGGGLEVALSAHYRLALPAATLGLPEVNLGLLPGSGGTQRAPRLMGVQAATAMMLSGQHLKAQAALQAGLVDKLVEGADAQAAGLAYVRELLAAKAPVRRTRDLAIAEPQAALAWLEEQKAETAKKEQRDPKIVGLIPAIQGILNGSIDLAFQAKATDGTPKFFVADYKSNQLKGGPDAQQITEGWPLPEGAPAGTPSRALRRWHYSQANLAWGMAHAGYHLQSLIYTVALHRWLQRRVPGYSYSANFGGHFYLYLRGMEGENSDQGVWFDRWPEATVLGLDAALAGADVATVTTIVEGARR